MLHSDPVLGHVDVDDRPGLHEQLPQQSLVNLLIQSSHIDGGVLVPLGHRSRGHPAELSNTLKQRSYNRRLENRVCEDVQVDKSASVAHAFIC